MEFTEELAAEVKSKFRVCDYSVERWRRKGIIPSFYFKNSKFLIKKRTLRECLSYLNLTVLELQEILRLRGVYVTEFNIINWMHGNYSPRKDTFDILKQEIIKLNKIKDNLFKREF